MTDHVAVGEVQADHSVFSGSDRIDHQIGDLGALHPRTLFERDHVGTDLHVLVERFVELPGTVSVEEIGHMSVLLGLADRQLVDSGRAEVFIHGPVDLRRIDQIEFRRVQIAVVLHHSGVEHRRPAAPVELVEIILLESGR